MGLLTIKKYLVNCFLLTIPILGWNLIFLKKLPAAYQPEIFWKDVPLFLTYAENTLRIFVFVLCFLMPLSINTKGAQRGLILYLTGLVLYFVSWLILIFLPDAPIVQHVIIFMAPAYTPFIWLMGIAFVANSFYFNIPFNRWIFITVSGLFLFFHNYHALMIYLRMN